MAKSKLVKVNGKITEAVLKGYQKVEDSVVDGYKKMETTVVGGYQKIDDGFVNQFLAHDGESVADARARLKDTEEVRRKVAKDKKYTKQQLNIESEQKKF